MLNNLRIHAMQNRFLLVILTLNAFFFLCEWFLALVKEDYLIFEVFIGLLQLYYILLLFGNFLTQLNCKLFRLSMVRLALFQQKSFELQFRGYDNYFLLQLFDIISQFFCKLLTFVTELLILVLKGGDLLTQNLYFLFLGLYWFIFALDLFKSLVYFHRQVFSFEFFCI